MRQNADIYFIEGCGRCSLGNTPACKALRWHNVLAQLRAIVLSCGLQEELKWGVPCYTFKNANVLIVGAFKDHCVIAFFKGSLLNDPEKILIKPGEYSQASRNIVFKSVNDVYEKIDLIKAYVFEAIEVERAGLKVEFIKDLEPIPEEFQQRLDTIPALREAFYALTPGRRRAYILYFLQPKQSKTRESRIEKCIPQILIGKGLNDDYRR